MPRRASSLWIHVVRERYWSGGWAYVAAAAVIAIGVCALRRVFGGCIVLAALLIATVLDVGMGLLLIGVSGFILQGVNNTGPMMPEAVLFVLMIALCVGAPSAAWFLRGRLAPLAVLAIAYSPLVVAGLVLLAGPMFA